MANSIHMDVAKRCLFHVVQFLFINEWEPKWPKMVFSLILARPKTTPKIRVKADSYLNISVLVSMQAFVLNAFLIL